MLCFVMCALIFGWSGGLLMRSTRSLKRNMSKIQQQQIEIRTSPDQWANVISHGVFEGYKSLFVPGMIKEKSWMPFGGCRGLYRTYVVPKDVCVQMVGRGEY